MRQALRIILPECAGKDIAHEARGRSAFKGYYVGREYSAMPSGMQGATGGLPWEVEDGRLQRWRSVFRIHLVRRDTTGLNFAGSHHARSSLPERDKLNKRGGLTDRLDAAAIHGAMLRPGQYQSMVRVSRLCREYPRRGHVDRKGTVRIWQLPYSSPMTPCSRA